MRSRVPYAALLVYAPKGSTDISRRSRDVCDAVKRGDQSVLTLAARRITELEDPWVTEFFGKDAVLVPTPGSAPMKDPKSLWVARDLCVAMLAAGLGREVLPCLERAVAVPKSAFALPRARARASRHFDSFVVDRPLIVPTRITLVDDVVTRGSTLLAAASKLAEAFPDSEVRAFAVVRTISPGEVSSILSPCAGVLTYDANKDSTRREP